VPECKFANIRVKVQNGDGLHHGVEFITFSNVSRTSCSLSGYPTVDAILNSGTPPANVAGIYAPSPTNAVKKAADVEYAWAGGVDSGDVAPKVFVAPVIDLKAQSGVATSTLNWVDGPNGNATCPAFSKLRIGVAGGLVTRFVRSYEPLCYEFAVTPIVAGKTGSMFVPADFSRKANELFNVKSGASLLRSEAAVLHRDLASPTKYSVEQELQVAASVRDTSQLLSQDNYPWSRLKDPLSNFDQDASTFSGDAVQQLVDGGSGRVAQKAYVKFLASTTPVENMLKQLS